MILGLAAVIVVCSAIVWTTPFVRRPGAHRPARWVVLLLGATASLLVVLGVVPSEAAAPVVLFATIASLVLVVLTLWVVSDVPSSPAQRWAEAHGVTLVDANREFVERYVSEGHRLRMVCGFGGAIAITALGRGLGIGVPVSGWVVLMVGYLGGVVWSEAWLTRLPAGTRRSASLVPRRVRNYLAGRLRIAQVVVPAVTLVVGIVAMTLPATPSSDPVTMDPAPESVLRTTALLIGLAAGLVVLGVAWLQRHIVTKPQPDADPDLLAADDAVRASSVHLLSGTGLGIVLVGLTSQVWLLGDLGIIGTGTAGGVGLGCTLAALIAWRYYGHRAWVVRRSDHPGLMDHRLGRVDS
jgi:hypothetical protein